jgi:AbrB family looped-hinge helix DNA binding protein
MATTKVSSKYQIVIPRQVREAMNIQEGQTLYVERINDTDLTISTKSALDRYAGSLKGAWGRDSDAWLRQERDSWDKRNV